MAISPTNDSKPRDFLRGMLKKPVMTWTQQPGEPTSAFLQRYEAQDEAVAQELNDILRAKHEAAAKENRPPGFPQQFAVDQNPLVHKALPTLASPTYQARGILPQVGGTVSNWLNHGASVQANQKQSSLGLGGGGISLSASPTPHGPSHIPIREPIHGFDQTPGFIPPNHYRAGDQALASIRAQERAEAAGFHYHQSTDW